MRSGSVHKWGLGNVAVDLGYGFSHTQQSEGFTILQVNERVLNRLHQVQRITRRLQQERRYLWVPPPIPQGTRELECRGGSYPKHTGLDSVRSRPESAVQGGHSAAAALGPPTVALSQPLLICPRPPSWFPPSRTSCQCGFAGFPNPNPWSPRRVPILCCPMQPPWQEGPHCPKSECEISEREPASSLVAARGDCRESWSKAWAWK